MGRGTQAPALGFGGLCRYSTGAEKEKAPNRCAWLGARSAFFSRARAGREAGTSKTTSSA